MQDSPDESLSRDAPEAPVADLADHRLMRTDLNRRAGTRVKPAPARLHVRRVDHPLGAVLSLDGELDLATVPLLQAQLGRAVHDKGVVVIDLTRLQFIDSSGLSVLVGAERQLRTSGRQMVLVYGPRSVRRVFEFASLDGYFASCDSPGAALRTARERRIGSRRIPKPATNRQPAGEPDGERPGGLRS